ncbi:acid beta-fructofuranosidase-like [Cucumis melo]|uniref:beta-fructofuranosidase n=1 Tax=Cucumis melo TaxID=3656 RepID=B6V3B8_CUCME|nr:acid beta-fructofuranosidase-like [Cucumis melo]ACJ04702.1 invertase 2 [Cucumis melo]
MDSTSSDLIPPPYSALPDRHPSPALPRKSRNFTTTTILISFLLLVSLFALFSYTNTSSPESVKLPENTQSRLARGVAEGVSAKSNPYFSDSVDGSFNWTNAMFSWQRTAFHFQPEGNWMNDPNGPLYHRGWYHLFYQYNPESAVWGNISWGHAVSRDLIHWLYLPYAMVPDQSYDVNGVWTGSATILPDGRIIMLYTGDTIDGVQVQNLAYPANLTDPLLLNWVKYPGNPVLVPPPGIGLKDFRDPTTAWLGPDGKWRITIGSRVGTTLGVSLVYTTNDFIKYELVDRFLHAVPGTGMWECVDFYPVSVDGSKGLDTSENGGGVKHVLKASLDDTKMDHYAIGTYFANNDTWVPDNPEEDVGIGLKYDYGRYYASKTFYDQNKERRILWGWINETDTEANDLAKGWASVQTVPKTVLFDQKTGSNIIQWPVEEVESLRLGSNEFNDVLLVPGSVVELEVGPATQLDILAEFEVEVLGSENGAVSEEGCGGGAAERSSLGPFGVLVLAHQSLSEFTPIYFNVANSSKGSGEAYFCADETRSSKAPDVFKQVYGSKIPVLEGENYSMRVLVDHSIVESFGQGGRRVITSRIYPTEAIYGAAKLFLFNNGTSANVKAAVKVWQLNSAFIQPYF